MPHFMIVLILYINLLNLSWIKNYIFEGYRAFISFSFSKTSILAQKLIQISQENRKMSSLYILYNCERRHFEYLKTKTLLQM